MLVTLHRDVQRFVEETDEVDWAGLSEEFFMRKLTQFLFSPRGAK